MCNFILNFNNQIIISITRLVGTSPFKGKDYIEIV